MKTAEFVNLAFRNANKRIKLAVYLALELADQPMYSTEIAHVCKALKISKNTLLRAAKDLGVKKTRIGFGKDGYWEWAIGPQLTTKGVDPILESILSLIEEG